MLWWFWDSRGSQVQQIKTQNLVYCSLEGMVNYNVIMREERQA